MKGVIGSRKRLPGRRLPAVVALGLLLAACGGDKAGPTQRYYDPQGLFSAEFPQSNDVIVVAPQPIANGPRILTGVLSQMPQATTPASPQAFGGGALGGATPAPDLALYAVFVVDARKSASVQAMADSLLASSPGGRDLQVLASQVIGGRPGLLMVNDHPGGGYSDASGFVLAGGVGYWIRELFPMGEWNRRSEGFLDLLRTFQFNVPPTISALPMGRPPLLLRSGTYWPVG
jgi:hypothetical protein